MCIAPADIIASIIADIARPLALLQAVPIRPVSIVALCLAPQEGYDPFAYPAHINAEASWPGKRGG
jgi:hypothetical protein